MAVDALAYAAEALKFIAVPAAIFELVPQKRRSAIESWLHTNLKEKIRTLAILLVVLYVTVVAFVLFGPYLVLFWIVVGRSAVRFVTFASKSQDSYGTFMVGDLALNTLVFLCAIVIALTPPGWVIGLSYPIEALSNVTATVPFLDFLVPDYSGEAYVARYDQVFEAIKDWLWDWLAWLNTLYFFWAKGFTLVVIVGIEIALMIVAVLICLLVPAIPLYAFTRFSSAIKSRFEIEAEGSIPVGAAVIWGFGETLSFTLRTIAFLE